MLDILVCIRDDHDLRFVAFAAAICWLSATAAVLILRHASRDGARQRAGWTAVGGMLSGIGIWATHFIAMLGYERGLIVGYRTGETAASLVLVAAVMAGAFLLVTRFRDRRGVLLGALLAGGGIAAMHYLGMTALEMPAMIAWRWPYVLLSLTLGLLPFYPALRLATGHQGFAKGLGAVLLMFGAIVGLHFSGMAAIHLVPSRIELQAATISPETITIAIAAIAMTLLALCLCGWVMSRRAAAAVADSERQFSILAKGLTDSALYLLDGNGLVTNWNAGAQRLKGYHADEVVGSPLARFYTVEDQDSDKPAMALAMAAEHGKFTGEGWRVRKDGTRFWAHVTIERIRDEAGKQLGFAKLTRDMTRLKEDQDRIATANRHLDAALEHMHQGLCLFDGTGHLVLRNRRFAELWQLSEADCLPGATFEQVARAAMESRSGTDIPPERIEVMRATLEQVLSAQDAPPVIREFGEEFAVSISSRRLPDGGWVTTFEDITERRRSEAQIAHMALHDGLTGLPNRTSFNRWLDLEIDNAAARDRQVALIAIDLDRFKEINDTQGHAAGDEVLQKVAAALSGALREGEIAARLGGDEFAVARSLTQKRSASDGEVAEFVSRIDHCLTSLGGHDEATDGETSSGGVVIGASLGIALSPDVPDREALLNNADLAMYRAKSSFSEHICYYEAGMDESARHRRLLANDLRQAIARNEFEVLYQPQRSLRTNEISGYEALLRWHHPRLGTISPSEFIPIAEETGEIIRIGEWVLRAACAEVVTWPGKDKIAVNLSPVQLLQADLPEVVTQILHEVGMSPQRLELEITETAIIADKTRALHTLRRIKALGVSVAMDDFGTGYSSLDTLHSFPFDKIKIDKSFLLESRESEQARAIIRAVLALGHSLGIPVLAEGVETHEQLQLLLGEGCDEAQGYYFGRPGPPPGVDRTLAVSA
ncbi:EAL domain-containing protein [Novosphingobium sp. KA1]|uniref:bifunctional diguanylate cyclase/phosphodiesterase n=1 Tax=Novosphingobium sp. (strain KA1) TaxID=164608 RepID=UPI001A8FBA8D|nr:EAL domain-containing protein [Novosphingobium sp. KA1]QSR19982.1 diguanylate cyclase [Novosphingobium sp. KA1]